MFRLSQRLLFSILLVVFAFILVPQPIPSVAQEASSPACAATPNTFGGQGWTLSGQGWTLSGQGWTLSGQGWTLSGQGWTLSGQNIDPLEVAEEIVTNQITADWFVDLLPGLTTGVGYGDDISAIVVIDDVDHGSEVMAVLNILANDPRIAPYMSGVQIHFLDIGSPPINYDSDQITIAIQNKVAELQAQGIDHINLNMSFGFLNCDDEATGYNHDEFLAARARYFEPKSVVPILECVYTVEHESYVARFAYSNENNGTSYIPVGHNNRLSRDRYNYLLPTLFELGYHASVFEIPFDRHGLTWTLEGPDGTEYRVTASSESPVCDDWAEFSPENSHNDRDRYCRHRDRLHPTGEALANEFNVSYNYVIGLFCGDNGHRLGWGQIRQRLLRGIGTGMGITPFVECVAYNGEYFTARFGYNSLNTQSIFIPVGDHNRFDGNRNMGQPTYFLPGEHNAVFEVRFYEGSPRWTLRSPDGQHVSATATPDSPPCLDDIGYTIADYMREELGLTDEETQAALTRFVMDVEDDSNLSPLRNLLQSYLDIAYATGNQQTVFATASSGNFYPWLGATPLVPARWSVTIASSGGLGNYGDLWRFSQHGNVRTPGAGYNIGNDFIVSGTSFATPGLVLALAQYGKYPSACEVQNVGGTTYPPLVNFALTNTPMSVDEANPLTCSLNNAPTAVDDHYNLVQGQALSILAPGILGNDSDPDGDTLTASLVTGAQHGSVTVGADGSFTYQHNGTYSFSDSFTYMINDGGNPNATDTATVYLTIEPDPGSVTSFTLIDAELGEAVSGYDPIIPDGEVVEIDLYQVGFRRFALRANTEGNVRSVIFTLNGETVRTENTVPYSMFGDDNGRYNAWDYEQDVLYHVVATPYFERDGGEPAGDPAELYIRFVDNTPTGTVESFTLVDAEHDQAIEGYNPIAYNGEVVDVDLYYLRKHRLNLLANTAGEVDRVVFTVNGELFSTEGSAPFSLAGDNGGDFNHWNFERDVIYSVLATPYRRDVAGVPTEIRIRFIDSTPVVGNVTSFTLIDADSDLPVAGYDPIIANGQVIEVDLYQIGIHRLAIRANTEGYIGSVAFMLDGRPVRNENMAPYAMVGDDNGDYSPWDYRRGPVYHIVATPYFEQNGRGNAGASAELHIRIIDTTPQVTPIVTEPVEVGGSEPIVIEPNQPIVPESTPPIVESTETDGNEPPPPPETTPPAIEIVPESTQVLDED